MLRGQRLHVQPLRRFLELTNPLTAQVLVELPRALRARLTDNEAPVLPAYLDLFHRAWRRKQPHRPARPRPSSTLER